MPTRKLYYEDCHTHTFRARVTGCTNTDNGYLVTLDATAFYPEGGGQACDTGILGTARVTAVWEQDAEVYHLCSAPLDTGSTVTGCIDYTLRFQRMQQHTGEHILSGILNRRYGSHNVGFHMGKEFVEVDFDTPIPAEDLKEIELAANQAIWENIPVRCWYPSPQELPQVEYRTKRVLPWPVRIVQVPGFDSCACCGVHVAMTGEIGLIKIVSCVRFHQGSRLEMVCGAQAYQYMAAVWEQNRLVSQAFSAKMLETGNAAAKMNDALAAEKFRAIGLQKQVFDAIAKDYVNQRDVLHFFAAPLDSAALRSLAGSIAGQCRGYCAVFAPRAAGGFDYCLASQEQDISALGKAMTAALRGRGGGKPGFQQGSLAAGQEEIAAFFAARA